MASPERYHGKTTAVLKKAAAILTTTGFFAAAVFLAAVLWLPANAASSSQTIDVQTSLLLTLDKPQPRTSKVRLKDLSSFNEENTAVASQVRPDLESELNGWTYTAGSTGTVSPLATIFLDLLALQFTILKFETMFVSGILQAFGFNVQGFGPIITSLSNIINGLLHPGGPNPTASPYH